MLTTPCHSTLKAFMTLVGSHDKDIKFHFFNNRVNVTILHDTVNISYALNHIHTLLSAIYKLATRLILQHDVRTLDSHYKIIANLLGTAEQLHMTYVQQIVNANSKDFLHHLVISCKVTTLFEKHKI